MSHRAQQKAEARAAREAAERAAVQSEQRRRRLMIFGGILAVAAVVLVTVVLAAGGGDDKPTAERVSLFDGIPQAGVTLGQEDAPVVVQEYADLQCPFCAQFAEKNLPAIVEDFVKSGEVKIELRLVSILGPDSTTAAEAVNAAAAQKKLWQYSEAFYAEQGPEGSGYVDEEFLRERAADAGVDFDKAWSERKSDAVQKLMQEAEDGFNEANLGGTPSFRVGPADGELKTVDNPDNLPAEIQKAVDAAGKD